MKNFLLIYSSPAEAKEAFASLTPEQMAEGMKPWMAWNERCGDAIVDLGAPNAPGTRLDTKGNVTATGGDIGGYSIIQAEDLAGAQALCENHPHLSYHSGCTLDIYECMGM